MLSLVSQSAHSCILYAESAPSEIPKSLERGPIAPRSRSDMLTLAADAWDSWPIFDSDADSRADASAILKAPQQFRIYGERATVSSGGRPPQWRFLGPPQLGNELQTFLIALDDP